MTSQADTAWQQGKPLNPDPAAFKPPHDNPNAVDHALIEGAGGKKEGGKDEGLVNPPIVSLNPTSQSQVEATDKNNYTIVDNAIFGTMLYSFSYPFQDLKPGQGMFIQVEKGDTTDKLMSRLYKQVAQFREQNSEVDRDQDGDDIMIDMAINKKQRNEDGTVKLDGDVPRLGISSGFKPKLLGPALTVKAIVKGDKLAEGNEAQSDGALVIRVA